MCAASFHKTCGSLTQSSVLLLNGNRVSHYVVQKTLNILQTTSPSALLIASCDATRKHLALHGEDDLAYTLYLSHNLRKEINSIPGFEAVPKEYFIQNGQFDYDETKIVIKTHGIDLTGFEIYQLLKDKYNIQMELGEVCVVLAVLTIGTTRAHCDSLVDALTDISAEYYNPNLSLKIYDFDFDYPVNILRPRVAYHAPQKKVHIDDAIGEICAESIIAYPPGIPLIIPGEEINQTLVNRLRYLRKYKTKILSDYDDLSVNIVDKDKWEKVDDYND
jgi:lysine decarboxylase